MKRITPLLLVLLACTALLHGEEGSSQPRPKDEANAWKVKVGDPAPNFTSTTLGGKLIKLANLLGSPVIVNFTSTGSPACKANTLKLVEIEAKYRDQGLKIMSVYLDTANKNVRMYEKTLGANWPVNQDGKILDNAAALNYGVSVIPTNVLVGKDGNILVLDLSDAQMDAEIQKAL
ncbi:MAG: TlpA disulfide reductase family protein [Chthoniobacterales bacterium]